MSRLSPATVRHAFATQSIHQLRFQIRLVSQSLADGTIYFADAGESNRIQKITPDGNVTTIRGRQRRFCRRRRRQALLSTRLPRSRSTGRQSLSSPTPETTAYERSLRKVRFQPSQATEQQVTRWTSNTSAVQWSDRCRSRCAWQHLRRRQLQRSHSPDHTDGQVSTVAGKGTPGYADGDRNTALFDTPCGIVVANDDSLIVADTGNDRLRKITPDGNVTTLPTTRIFRIRSALRSHTITFFTLLNSIDRAWFKSHPMAR